MRDVSRVSLVASIAMLILPPIVELATNLAPRWPSPIGWNIVLGIVCSALLWVLEKRCTVWLPQARLRRRVIFSCVVASCISILSYVAGDAMFCWYDPPARSYSLRVVAGFRWANEDIRTLAQTTSVIDLLRGSPWDPEQVWAPWSIATVRLFLFISWTAGWLFSACALAVVSADLSLSRNQRRTGQSGLRDEDLQREGLDSGTQLDGNFCDLLSDAIQDAFPTPQSLRQLLASRLSDDIYNYAGLDSEYPDIRFELVQSYNSRGQIEELVNALLEENPTNAKLREFQLLAFDDKSNR